MKLPFLDIHIVRGRNVMTDGQLKEQKHKDYVRNKQTSLLLDKIDHLKGLLRQK